jgi:hypothetical protein
MEAPYIECGGCYGRGYVKGPVDEQTGQRILRDHEPCNGSGILIRREHHGGEFHYGAPKLS